MHYPSINLNIHPSLCSTLAMFLALLLPFSRLCLTPSKLTIFFITICPPLTSLAPRSPSCSLAHTLIQPSFPPPNSPCPSSLAHAAAGSHHGSKPRRLPHAKRGFPRHTDPPDGGAQHQQPPTHPHDPGVGWVSSNPGWALGFIPFAFVSVCVWLCMCVFVDWGRCNKHRSCLLYACVNVLLLVCVGFCVGVCIFICRWGCYRSMCVCVCVCAQRENKKNKKLELRRGQEKGFPAYW